MTASSEGAAALNNFLTEFLNEASLQNVSVVISGQGGVHGFGLGFHLMEAESLHVMEEESLDMMEAERLVPVSAPIKPKRLRLRAPVSLIRSGKMTDRSGNRKATKHMGRKHVRSDRMVLNFEGLPPRCKGTRESANDDAQNCPRGGCK